MQPILADVGQVEWIVGILASILGSGGLVALAMKVWFDWKDKNRVSRDADGKSIRDAKAAEMELGEAQLLRIIKEQSESHKHDIEEVRAENKLLKAAMEAVREKTTQSIVALMNEKHAAEQRNAALTVELRLEKERREGLEIQLKLTKGHQ